MKKTIVIPVVIVLVIFAIAFLIFKKPGTIPSVSVQDQKIIEDEVIIDEVIAAKTSWLVIQTNEEGVPGPVLGYTRINAGSNSNVKVKIDTSQATPSLHAMIHKDDGKKVSLISRKTICQ